MRFKLLVTNNFESLVTTGRWQRVGPGCSLHEDSTQDKGCFLLQNTALWWRVGGVGVKFQAL
jgi:hypothetical protein